MGGIGTLWCMAESERTPFGERLFKARTHAKLSQPQLATAVGLRQSTIGELEKKGNGSQKTTQIALACGVRPEWLASGEGPMLPPPVPKPRPELQEVIRAFQGLKEHQVGFVMDAIRGVLDAARYVPDPTDQREEPSGEESSSSKRRSL